MNCYLLRPNSIAVVVVILLSTCFGVDSQDGKGLAQERLLKDPYVDVKIPKKSCGDVMALVSWKLGYKGVQTKSSVVTCESSGHSVIKTVDAKESSVYIGPLYPGTEYLCSVQPKGKILGGRKPIKSKAIETASDCDCISNATCTGNSDTCNAGTCVCGTTGAPCPGENQTCVSGVCTCNCSANELCYQDNSVPRCCTRIYSYGTFARDSPNVPTSGTFESISPATLSFAGTWDSDGPVANVDDTSGKLDGTPFDQVYGSSQGSGYASVQCASANRSANFTFDTPTVPGFGFTLGDVDAENVFVKAFDNDGNELTGAELGYESSFNYESQSDTPVWVQAESKLQGGGADTGGASAWFQPKKPIKTLVLTCQTIIGSPAYQLWMAAPQCTP